MKENKLLQVLCFIIVLFFTLCFGCLSPYKYAWDETIKQPDDQSIEVMNFFSPLIFLFIFFGLLLAKGSKRWVFIVYGIVIASVIAKLIYINAIS
ncbi:hypothetical protein ACFOTA_24015 [Chitinophaga sp. GCM10012297]|uniref:Uncharacterized protein n=1 Tax=Chitinophaga chungangae TaxID=2821488 RepID=A0ABS3YKT7_9BACT|nr:hypothetical protein [Chitinophaga chungangae]MBO9155298.1 hypothetical protein [Chitinophaga chungangae]